MEAQPGSHDPHRGDLYYGRIAGSEKDPHNTTLQRRLPSRILFLLVLFVTVTMSAAQPSTAAAPQHDIEQRDTELYTNKNKIGRRIFSTDRWTRRSSGQIPRHTRHARTRVLSDSDQTIAHTTEGTPSPLSFAYDQSIAQTGAGTPSPLSLDHDRSIAQTDVGTPPPLGLDHDQSIARTKGGMPSPLSFDMSNATHPNFTSSAMLYQLLTAELTDGSGATELALATHPRFDATTAIAPADTAATANATAIATAPQPRPRSQPQPQPRPHPQPQPQPQLFTAELTDGPGATAQPRELIHTAAAEPTGGPTTTTPPLTWSFPDRPCLRDGNAGGNSLNPPPPRTRSSLRIAAHGMRLVRCLHCCGLVFPFCFLLLCALSTQCRASPSHVRTGPRHHPTCAETRTPVPINVRVCHPTCPTTDANHDTPTPGAQHLGSVTVTPDASHSDLTTYKSNALHPTAPPSYPWDPGPHFHYPWDPGRGTEAPLRHIIPYTVPTALPYVPSVLYAGGWTPTIGADVIRLIILSNTRHGCDVTSLDFSAAYLVVKRPGTLPRAAAWIQRHTRPHPTYRHHSTYQHTFASQRITTSSYLCHQQHGLIRQ